MEFSVKDIIALLKKRLLLIVICTFVGFVLCYGVSHYVLSPSYKASVQMYVNSNDSISTADLNELYYAQKVVTTYVNFLQTKVFYEKVLEESQLNFTLQELEDMTSVKSVNNTEIFQISVTASSPEAAFQLAAAMQKVAPELIKSIKRSAQISIVDPVVMPTIPSGPNTLLNTTIGGMAGLLLSLLVCFLWEILDINVKNQDDLLNKYQIPILSTIPDFSTHTSGHRIFHKVSKGRRISKNRRLEIYTDEETKFIVTEAYKTLRTNLRFTLRKEGCKKILINSPMMEEGKSTTCSNLGITIAQTGAKVLLIDCDMRKGQLHTYFKVKSAPGLSDILSGALNEKDVIMETAYANINVISMGSIPPNPTELLTSIQMEELIKRVEKNYDYIIIDSPPVNIVSDALSLLKPVDGVLIVVREQVTSHPQIANAMMKYKLGDAKLLGFVLNGMSIKKDRKSKSLYYYKRRNE